MSRVASCYQQQDQMHAAQIAQIGWPAKNYLQSSATPKMQLQVAFWTNSALALFVWLQNQISSVSQIFDLVWQWLTWVEKDRDLWHPTCQLSLFMSESILGSSPLLPSSSLSSAPENSAVKEIWHFTGTIILCRVHFGTGKIYSGGYFHS